jgi:hypothetical protein
MFDFNLLQTPGGDAHAKLKKGDRIRIGGLGVVAGMGGE